MSSGSICEITSKWLNSAWFIFVYFMCPIFSKNDNLSSEPTWTERQYESFLTRHWLITSIVTSFSPFHISAKDGMIWHFLRCRQLFESSLTAQKHSCSAFKWMWILRQTFSTGSSKRSHMKPISMSSHWFPPALRIQFKICLITDFFWSGLLGSSPTLGLTLVLPLRLWLFETFPVSEKPLY